MFELIEEIACGSLFPACERSVPAVQAGNYAIDDKQVPDSVWRASIPVGEKRDIRLWMGALRGSKKEPGGSGALHLLSAYACEAGLVIGQRAVDGKSNEIKAIPELLEMLAITGAIVSIDAMDTQKAIAATIAVKEADTYLPSRAIGALSTRT
ncbi:MAG: ISAs1 family transposase [Pseudomonadota bacterium]|nr:ISAs1 family transposase [Pseudomonadota bacterium]